MSAPRKWGRASQERILSTLVSDLDSSLPLGFWPKTPRSHEAPGDLVPGDQVTEWKLGGQVVWIRDERTPPERQECEDILLSTLETITAQDGEVPSPGLLAAGDAEYFFRVASEGLARAREVASMARIRSDGIIRRVRVTWMHDGQVHGRELRGYRHHIAEALAHTPTPWMARMRR